MFTLVRLINSSAGYGTYAVGTAMILYGLVGRAAGMLSQHETTQIIFEALGVLFLRRAVGAKHDDVSPNRRRACGPARG